MYALRERRQHVTQEDFEFAVAKVRSVLGLPSAPRILGFNIFFATGSQEAERRQYVREQVVHMITSVVASYNVSFGDYNVSIFLFRD